jgi:hypothetical protein
MRMADWREESAAATAWLCHAGRRRRLRLHAAIWRRRKFGQGDIEGGALAHQAWPSAKPGLRASSADAQLLRLPPTCRATCGPAGPDRQSLLIYRETGDRISEAWPVNQGEGWLKLGDLAQSRRDLDAALQMRGPMATGPSKAWPSTACRRCGRRRDAALALARQALDIAVATKARDFEGAGVACAAEPHWPQGGRAGCLRASARAGGRDRPMAARRQRGPGAGGAGRR